MIRSGALRIPLEVQARTEASDGMGGTTTTWTIVGVAWAEMWSVKGEERAASASVQASVTHRARIRAFAGLTTAHRLTLGARSFGITFINDVEQQGREYVVDLLEIVGRGAQ